VTINTEMPVRVTAITKVADTVKRFRLARIDGAHVVVTMKDGSILRRNPYSLMSSPTDRSAYEISVLRVETSRGGSHFLHDHVKVGDTLAVTQPVNLFTIDQRGKKHILFAGGIGITPFIAMMDQMAEEGHTFELHYAVRTRTHGAYWKELQDRYGASRIKIYCDAEKLFIPTEAITGNQPLGTHLYVCGPKGMIESVLGTARKQGWPAQNLHAEEFLAPPSGKPFEIKLVKSNKTITVGEHQSMLEAIESAGVDAPYMCRGGACGMCETGVVSCKGTINHNDIYLEPDDKASGKKIMICVSRIKGDSITLDL
jgi:dimethylamine monooxygenase subunit B